MVLVLDGRLGAVSSLLVEIKFLSSSLAGIGRPGLTPDGI